MVKHNMNGQFAMAYVTCGNDTKVLLVNEPDTCRWRVTRNSDFAKDCSMI